MSTQVPLPAAIRTGREPIRSGLIGRARTLSLLSIGWMTLEAGVAITAAVLAGSVALIAFGLDSLIELASAGTILWLYTAGRDRSEAAERRAQQLVAACFVALALVVSFDAIATLAAGSRPGASWLGVAVAGAAIVVMPLLARAKQRVAAQLGSSATAGDAAQSWLCALSAVAALAGVAANAALGWWWLDPIAGLAIAGIAAREADHTWRGEVCGDCGSRVLPAKRGRRELSNSAYPGQVRARRARGSGVCSGGLNRET